MVGAGWLEWGAGKRGQGSVSGSEIAAGNRMAKWSMSIPLRPVL
jgi:hypothetical protein